MIKEKRLSQLTVVVVTGALLALGIGAVVLLAERAETEQKIETLKQKIEALISGQERVPFTEREFIPPAELTPEEQKRREEEIRWIKEFRPETILEIMANGNKRTETFSLAQDPRTSLMWNFYILEDDELLTVDKLPFYKVSLYKVGQDNLVFTHEKQWTKENVVRFKQFVGEAWVPATPEALTEWQKARRGADKIHDLPPPPGVVSGIDGSFIQEPSEYYFEIETRNVDKWFLEVRKILAP